MAQTTRSTAKRRKTSRSTSGNPSSSRSSRGNSSSRSTSGRSGNSRGRSSSASTAKRSRQQTGPRSRSTSSNGPVAKTGGKVAELASKAKTPLVAGGAVLAGIAGGVALKGRNESRRPLKALRSVSLPKSLKNIDLDQLIEAGRTVRSLGDQVGDVADTAAKTRKKHK